MLIGVEAASGDRELRRRVVAAFPEFLSRCTRGHAVLEAIAAEYSLPSYLLGLMNTAYLTAEQSAITEADLRAANPGSERSRMGDDHWSLLVASGFAERVGPGWKLTPAGGCRNRATRSTSSRGRAPHGAPRTCDCGAE